MHYVVDSIPNRNASVRRRRRKLAASHRCVVHRRLRSFRRLVSRRIAPNTQFVARHAFEDSRSHVDSRARHHCILFSSCSRAASWKRCVSRSRGDGVEVDNDDASCRSNDETHQQSLSECELDLRKDGRTLQRSSIAVARALAEQKLHRIDNVRHRCGVQSHEHSHCVLAARTLFGNGFANRSIGSVRRAFVFSVEDCCSKTSLLVAAKHDFSFAARQWFRQIGGTTKTSSANAATASTSTTTTTAASPNSSCGRSCGANTTTTTAATSPSRSCGANTTTTPSRRASNIDRHRQIRGREIAGVETSCECCSCCW